MSDVLQVSESIFPTLEAPETAPAPSFDLANPKLTFVDLFPENFFSLEGLQVICRRGRRPRLP